MTYKCLRDFISTLEQHNKLVRVSTAVSTHLEMTEIGTRLIAQKGPAVLFENVEGYNMPVLINLFGTVERVAMAMNLQVDELRKFGQELAFLRQPTPPDSLKQAVTMLPLAQKALKMRPKHVSNAKCQEIILTGNDIDLYKMPIQGCWPDEPAPLITWPLVVTKPTLQNGENNNELYNIGIYRMQVLSRNSTLMRWLKHRGGAQHHAAHKQHSTKPFPAAVVIGSDPATILAAVCPVPDTISEYQFAGLLRRKPLELVECKTIDLKVPANAEIILEGHVSLDKYGDEGPYGDHTGYYNSVEKFPIFTITAITMRKNPIYLSTYTGKPPDEPSILGEALNELFIPLLQQQFPEIIDFWLPPEGCSYRVAVVSIKKAYAGHGRRIMMAIWSYLRQFIYTKFVIVVDDDIDCRNWQEVIWAISTRMDPVRDTMLVENTPIDYLDFASPISGIGGKMGMDATNKWPGETNREWGKKIYMEQDIIEKVTAKWEQYGLPGDGKPIWQQTSNNITKK